MRTHRQLRSLDLTRWIVSIFSALPEKTREILSVTNGRSFGWRRAFHADNLCHLPRSCGWAFCFENRNSFRVTSNSHAPISEAFEDWRSFGADVDDKVKPPPRCVVKGMAIDSEGVLNCSYPGSSREASYVTPRSWDPKSALPPQCVMEKHESGSPYKNCSSACSCQHRIVEIPR